MATSYSIIPLLFFQERTHDSVSSLVPAPQLSQTTKYKSPHLYYVASQYKTFNFNQVINTYLSNSFPITIFQIFKWMIGFPIQNYCTIEALKRISIYLIHIFDICAWIMTGSAGTRCCWCCNALKISSDPERRNYDPNLHLCYVSSKLSSLALWHETKINVVPYNVKCT